MQENTIDPEVFIKEFDENLFFDAVDELSNNDILFEGQFPFLDAAVMKDRNLQILKDIFKKFGYDDAEHLKNISAKVEGGGWMFCLYKPGGRFDTIANVEKAIKLYYRF